MVARRGLDLAGSHPGLAPAPQNDQLEQRGRLGQQAKAAAESGLVAIVTEFRTESVTAQPDGRLTLTSVNGPSGG